MHMWLSRLLFGTMLLCVVPRPEARAQFDIVPTDSLVSVFDVDSITRIFQVDFPNLSGDSLGLTWRWVDGGWTEGWDVNLCDLGECYTGVPADAEMLPMGPEGAGFLKLIVNALELEGSCFLHFWVYPTGNPDALVDVWFDLRNEAGWSGIDVKAPTDLVPLLYPVPARSGEPITLVMPPGIPPGKAVQLFDGNGVLISAATQWWGHRLLLETRELPAGSYILKYEGHIAPLRFTLQ